MNDTAICRFCYHNLTISKKTLVGLATRFIIQCSNKNCKNSDKSFDNCDKIVVKNDIEDNLKTDLFYDLNLRLVYGLRSIGKGYTAARVLLGLLNLPAPPTKYFKHQKVLADHSKTLCLESMKTAVAEAVVANKGSTDLCVAIDGSWQKRGHTSMNGVLTVTSVDTGKVLDFHSMSKYCRCPRRGNSEHLGTCEANYQGTSGGMEVEGVLTVFNRSVPLHGVKYADYLGDGDSKGYLSVCESQPYGPDYFIDKVECIGHVQKRMGTRLRNLKAQQKKRKLSDGKTIGGPGRLTNAAIQKIQTFYGLAIRRNTGSIDSMVKACWAVFFHIQSSNNSPQHLFCPAGLDSWCKYNKAFYLKEKYNHKKHFHIPTVVMKELKPIFKSLSDRVLLQKCLKGKTQNPNESLNNLIWSYLPKRVFVRLDTLDFGVSEAVLSFNDGFISKVRLFQQLQLKAGRNMVRAMKRLDQERIKRADKATEEVVKKIRQSRCIARRKLEDLYEAQEDPDKPSYSGGSY